MERESCLVKKFVCLLSVVFLTCGVAGSQTSEKGKSGCRQEIACGQGVSVQYEPTWESLDARPMPKWWTDAKFGIFIHWGVYSVPSWSVKGQYSEWYWRKVTDSKKKNGKWWKFHKETYGEDFEYRDFAGLFKAELYDPEHWADVFYRSGAKYVVPTSKHHDGFCLWPSAEANKSWGRPWNSVAVGPKRDLLGELTEVVRKKGLRMGIYYSLYEWYNPLWLTDKKRYVKEHMIPQFKDVVTRYKPAVIFADGEWDLPESEWQSRELLAWLFNESACREYVVINDRWGKESSAKRTRHKHGGYYTTEYGAGLKDSGHPWEETRGMGHSFGYSRNESLSDYKSARELVLMLVDLVSRGGNFLLDIGPTGDGRIPVIMEERLIEMGQWLGVNGEAIYGTRPWRKSRQWSSGESPKLEYGRQYRARYDIRELTAKPAGGKAVVEVFFTSKADAVYAIVPHWPGSELVLKEMRPLKNIVVTMLGGKGSLEWKAAGGDIVIEVPKLSVDEVPCRYAYVFKLMGVE